MGVERPSIAVVGATGAVGREVLAILAQRGHGADRVRAFASGRSAGERVAFGDAELAVERAELDHLVASDLCVLAAGADVARELAPAIVGRGGLVVDNSSAFREDPEVPLIVPEVNGAQLADGGARLVANPNCTTILLLVALEPLRRAFGIERVVVSTYQAVSGAGLEAMRELEVETRAALDGRAAEPHAFPESCAFNVFPHESEVDPESGLNAEERKLVRETRRIWNDPAARLVPTCVRVPVLRSHAESVVVTLARPATEADARAALESAPGVQVLDDRELGTFPTSLRATGGDDVLVGRLRPAPDEPLDAAGRTRTFCLWLCGDQLRKGAALNALQIGDLLLAPARRRP